MQFLWGIPMIIIGVLIVLFSEPIYNFTGAIEFIERRSAGGSRGFIKLFGVIVIILGILTLTGVGGILLDPFGQWFAGLFSLQK